MGDWKHVQAQYWKQQAADVFPHHCFSLPPVVPQARTKAFILHLNKQTREQQRLEMTHWLTLRSEITMRLELDPFGFWKHLKNGQTMSSIWELWN